MPPIQNQVPPPGYIGYPQMPTEPPRKKSFFSGLMPAVIILAVLLVVAITFGVWAYMQRQDYMNNSNAKSAAAVKVAEKTQEEKLNVEFAEKEKSPYKTYQSTADFGSVKIVYPKLWGSYVDESPQSGEPVNGFFNPNFVPKTTGEFPIAFRVQVISTPYAQTLQEYEGQIAADQIKASPVIVEGVKGVTGMRFDGKITPNYSGSIVLFPVRDKTLKIWTEIPANLPDFNNILLKNLTFVP